MTGPITTVTNSGVININGGQFLQNTREAFYNFGQILYNTGLRRKILIVIIVALIIRTYTKNKK